MKSSSDKQSTAGKSIRSTAKQGAVDLNFAHLAEISMEAALDAVLWIRMDGEFLYANDSACRSLGYTRKELLKLKIFDIDSNFTAETWPEHWERVKVCSTRTILDSTHTHKDGSVVPVEISINHICMDGEELHCSFVRDRTERMMAEDALRNSEEKFRALAEQSPNMIFINYRGRIVYANAMCEEVMGYKRAELYADDSDFFVLIAPESREMTARDLQEHMKGNEVPAFESVLVTKSGEQIPATISTKLVKYEGGKAIIGIVTDVSELKNAENRLRRSAGLLRKQKTELQGKNVALKEVLAQIESEKLEFKKQVTDNVEKLIMPIIRRQRRKGGDVDHQYLDALEVGLHSLTSGFARGVSGQFLALSPRELEITGLIRDGMTTKEMAELMGISLRTIETHRNKIRKKLGISREMSLATYLQSIR